MKIGLIVYSETGNTLSVAQKLEEALKTAGHTVTISKIAAEKDSSGKVTKLLSAPAVGPYEAVIFASPIQGFSLSPVMKLYLSQISSLSGKKVACFVTQHLKKNWMGGSRAVRQITEACKAKNADIASSGIVHWSSASREAQIDEVIRCLSAI